jgi:hypothetical protein
MDRVLIPERPAEAHVPEVDPDTAHIECAHLLTEEATPRLSECGFTPDQVLAWAKAYLVAEHSGDVDGFIAWIAEREHCPNAA